MSVVVQRRLQAGRHQHPDDGTCLMEYVSMLAGQPFTDAPRCTEPLVAELARMVNDGIGEEARSTLISLAPRLAQLPRVTALSAPAIVCAALDAALRGCPGRTDLLRHRRRALRRAVAEAAGSGQFAGLRSAFYRYGPARHALSCAVYVVAKHSASEAARDTALTTMLEEAMAAGGPARVRVSA